MQYNFLFLKIVSETKVIRYCFIQVTQKNDARNQQYSRVART